MHGLFTEIEGSNFSLKGETDCRVFGEDANVFRPERWLEDDERARQMERALFTFGQGARTCIGKVVEFVKCTSDFDRTSLCLKCRSLFQRYFAILTSNSEI